MKVTYIRDTDLASRYEVDRTTIWRWSQSKTYKFPAPVKLSPGCTRWRLSDVEQWEDERGMREAG